MRVEYNEKFLKSNTTLYQHNNNDLFQPFKVAIATDINWLVWSRILESLAGCRTKFIIAVFCKIGALERNAYWFHVKLIFIVIFGQSFKLDIRA